MKTKHFLLIVIVFALGSLIGPQTVRASEIQAEAGPYYDLPLCIPGYYANLPGDCLPLGPSQTISRLREQGFPYPLVGLPANNPDPSLNVLPIRIASINDGQTKVYASLSDATSGGTVIRSYPGGLSRYVAFVEQANAGGSTFVRLLGGGWIEAQPLYSIPNWQGLEFFDSPQSDFGFTIDGTGSFNGASFSSGATGNTYGKYVSFPIYNMVEAEGYEWYQVSPTEWIPSLKSRRVVVDTATPQALKVVSGSISIYITKPYLPMRTMSWSLRLSSPQAQAIYILIPEPIGSMRRKNLSRCRAHIPATDPIFTTWKACRGRCTTTMPRQSMAFIGRRY